MAHLEAAHLGVEKRKREEEKGGEEKTETERRFHESPPQASLGLGVLILQIDLDPHVFSHVHDPNLNCSPAVYPSWPVAALASVVAFSSPIAAHALLLSVLLPPLLLLLLSLLVLLPAPRGPLLPL